MKQKNTVIPSGFKGFDAIQGGYVKGLPYIITQAERTPGGRLLNEYIFNQIKSFKGSLVDIISHMPCKDIYEEGLMSNHFPDDVTDRLALRFFCPGNDDKNDTEEEFKKRIRKAVNQSNASLIIIECFEREPDLDLINFLAKDKNSAVLAVYQGFHVLSNQYPHIVLYRDVFGQLQAKVFMDGEMHIIPSVYEKKHESIGVSIIEAERIRQIAQEGYSPEHDRQHTEGELADAAATYALTPAGGEYVAKKTNGLPGTWPFSADAYKPTPKDRIRQLAKAGAFIAAEIDRLKQLT